MNYINNAEDKIRTYLKNYKLPNYFYLCFFWRTNKNVWRKYSYSR